MEFWATSLLYLKTGGYDEHCLLGKSTWLRLAKQQLELCECRGRRKGRQDILRILMYIRGHWIKFTYYVLGAASVLQMKHCS